ncbi:MAG: universal stress protein [Dehalococcoidia bacterium]|nr:universal stress protein [Dehalococcoidia bacterium]
MFSKILVPLDGTPESEAALGPTAEIAKRFDSTVVLVQVTPGYGQIIGATAAESFGASGSVAAAQEIAVAAESAASSYLDAIRTKYGTSTWETVVAEGNSSDTIVEQARGHAADLIVMATHARKGLARLFLGSVSEDVIRKCGIPVLVVHADLTDED